MATYKVYNYSAPKNWKDYMPDYTQYNYTKPKEAYSDFDTPYGYDIRKAQLSLEQLDKNKPTAYRSQYGNNINALINNMANRKFAYDVNADALYNQYKKNYMNQGKLAMQDTIGQAAAMTGGYGNSYAATVGNQAYQSYLEKLNDRIPELYQLALDRYNTEGADMQNLYSMMANQEAQEYGKYRDTVGDYQTDRGYYDAQLQNLRTMGQNLWGQNWNNYWNAADRTDTNRQNAVNTALNLYGQDWDNYHWAENQTQHNYEQAVAEDQWNADFAENQRQFNENQAQAAAQAAAELAYQREKALAGTGSNNNNTWSNNNNNNASIIKDMSGSAGVKNFESGKLTREEFSRRGNSTKIGNSTNRYDSYTDYLDALIENWLKTGRLTNNEASYLIDRYL